VMLALGKEWNGRRMRAAQHSMYTSDHGVEATTFLQYPRSYNTPNRPHRSFPLRKLLKMRPGINVVVPFLGDVAFVVM
jgi:hypothetical protein